MFSWTFNNLTGLFPRPSSPPKAPLTPKKPAVRNTPEEAPESVLAPNPHLAARRAQALRSLFPKLSSWFGSRRDALYIGEINEYLAQASNVTDLEQRIRLIEQQRHFS
jgi:hypothetical protein